MHSGKIFLWASIWAVERRSRSNTLKVMTEERNFSPLTCITSQDFSIDTNILWPPMAPNVCYGPPKHQLGRQTWYRHSLRDFRLGWLLTSKKPSTFFIFNRQSGSRILVFRCPDYFQDNFFLTMLLCQTMQYPDRKFVLYVATRNSDRECNETRRVLV